MSRQGKQLIVGVGLALLLLTVYELTAARQAVNYADADDLTLAAKYLGLAHPPGYPLLIVMMHVAMKLWGGQSPAYVANALAGGLTALTAWCLYGLIWACQNEMSGKVNRERSTVIAAAAVGLWGLSHSVWLHATVRKCFP